MSVSKLGGYLVVAALTLTAVTPASASVIFETASYTGQDTGEYIVQDGNFIGAAFTLNETTNITAIGAQFGGFPSGSVFGAIVSLSGASAPAVGPDQIESITLGYALFSPPTVTAVDMSEDLSLMLGPGTYGIIFGSGHFGATGYAGLGSENTPVGSPVMFQSLFSPGWDSFTDNGVRLFVEGDAVSETPLPAALPLFASGLAGLGFVARRRKRAVAA